MNGEEEVEEIIWLEDPHNFDYVREGIAASCVRDGGAGSYNFYKVIGYENCKKRGKGIQVYHRRFWWLEKHDKGCPEAIEEYQNGTSRPNEAINPKNINIPEGVRIIKTYEIEKVVPECRYGNKYNLEYNKAKREKRPFMVVVRSSKYAYFHYDMWTTNFNLKTDAVDELGNLLSNFLNHLSKDYAKTIIKKREYRSVFSSITGSTPKIRIFECRAIAKQLKEIIVDKKNWIDCRNET